jgi:hypothetical protein
MSDRCSVTFEEVLKAELDVVGDAITAEAPPVAEPQVEGKAAPAAEDQIARAHKKQLVGLAFSGGGIRSATFNLGVLQALAQMRLLGRFDYLSTVSGGGYIGAWLMAWIKRRGMRDVAQALRPEWATQPGHSEPGEIHFLRQFSNYLTPKLGWLGADMWTVIATYLRNLILNLTVLVAAMTLVLILPRVIAITFRSLWGHGNYWLWVVPAVLGVIMAMVVITRSLTFFRRKSSDWRTREKTHEQFEWRDATWIVIENEEGEGTGARDASGWVTRDQKPLGSLGEAVRKDAVFYATEYGDFVLKAEFTATPKGRSAIAVWCPPDNVEDGYLIHVCGAFAQSPYAGAIDDHKPVRPAALRPERNDIEISCVKNAITVRINGETINHVRVSGKRATGPDCFRRGTWENGWIGLGKSDGVQFHNMRLRSLPANMAAGGTQDQIQQWIVAPLFAAAFLATFLFCFGDVSRGGAPGVEAMRTTINPAATPIQPLSWTNCALVSGGVTAVLILLVRMAVAGWEAVRARLRRINRPARGARAVINDICREAASLGAASLVGGIGIRALYELFLGRTLWEVVAWGTPALISLTMLVLTVHIGLLGKSMPDELREWWSRLGAWLLIYSLVWVAIFVTAFYAAPFFSYLNSYVLKGVSVAWLASTLWGVFAARSAATGQTKSSTVRDLVAQVTPYIFIVGLFLFLAWGIGLVIPLIAGTSLPYTDMPPGNACVLIARHWRLMDVANNGFSVGCVALGAILISLIFSWRLDVNQFSMHLLYRNRLGRCYLGASNRFRRAQPFTGFAADDDFSLWELDDLLEKQKPAQSEKPSKERMTAPYLIINAALNLVGGKELAWQQRKAASFVFTQKFCGYDFPELPPGYSPTPEYAASVSPVTLATAMAISGAAASPNMGYHTSPASAFLMTVFNVRLGWWLGNPRSATWERSSPGNVLLSLLRELFGLTSDEGKYIYLSDGGHFENLGIYELVRRRCRFILACDAEEDHAFGFGGLGNAIEKCRADLGVDIEIDVEPIRRRNEQGHTHWHCAIGKVHYSSVDENQPDGILVYLKSSLTGDEPSDVLRYAAENAGFPHQSTNDQWFDESQFESYRALGCHIAQDVFGAVDSAEKISLRSKEQLFVELAQRWYPPSDATRDCFTRLTQPLAAIYEELRRNKQLLFLNEQIYPEWRVLFENTEGAKERMVPGTLAQVDAKTLRSRLPEDPEKLLAGFYMCSQIIQVMENTYVDLQLENEYDHPDNRGWMNLFRHWSWAPMFRVTWAVTASTYGARFQSFCERHLELKLGGVELEELKGDAASSSDAPVPMEAQRVSEEPVKKDTVAPADGPAGKPRSVSDELTKTIEKWLCTELPLDTALRSRAAAEAARIPPGRGEALSEEAVVARAGKAIREALGPKAGERTLPPPNAYQAEKDQDPEWFAAATLVELIRRDADNNEREKWANLVAHLVHLRDADIAKLIFASEIEQGLNAAEFELLKLFFVYNPKLVKNARIFRFYLVPGKVTEFSQRGKQGNGGQPRTDGKSASRADELRFPFAFAILAMVTNEQTGTATESLVYFRVQDHVRRMGLGREALQKMLRDEGLGDLKVKLYEMHPDAHEVPTSQDRLRFLRLFDSAQALRQTDVRVSL